MNQLPKVVEDAIDSKWQDVFFYPEVGSADTIEVVSNDKRLRVIVGAALTAYDSEYVEPMVNALKPFLEDVPHYVCDEDCWYSCPKSGECCNHSRDECNCGAEKENAKRAILRAALTKWQNRRKE